jgi:glucose-6-phosphate isomerase
MVDMMESGASGRAWAPISESPAWKDLKTHVKTIEEIHLRQLLLDQKRCENLIKEYDGVVVDFSRQRVTDETLAKLFALAKTANLKSKIDQMFGGVHINTTEDRPVLHAALRAPRDEKIVTDGKNVVPEVYEVLDKIKSFSERVRTGKCLGATGKPLTDVVAIGIGGSFLGPLFVHTAFQTDPQCAVAAKGRSLRL